MQATDGDLGENGTVRYLRETALPYPFGLKLDTGVIYATEEFVEEFASTNQLQYRFGIIARDNGVATTESHSSVIVS